MLKSRALAFALLLFFHRCAPVVPAHKARHPYHQLRRAEQRKTSEPYTGDLSIFESPGRDERLQINRVMDILGIAPGKAVADIGAGSGWFTVRAAKRVGETGVVYAVDINPEATQYIGDRAQKETSAQHKANSQQAGRPPLPAEFGGRGADPQDISRNRGAHNLLRNLRTRFAPARR